jgi:hypothetical protein
MSPPAQVSKLFVVWVSMCPGKQGAGQGWSNVQTLTGLLCVAGVSERCGPAESAGRGELLRL